MPRYDVNISILFTELPLLQRPHAVRAAGFEAVECWWPFDSPVPGDREVDAFVGAVRDAGVRLVALNAYGGDLAAGDRGLAALAGREAEFRDALDAATGLAAALEVPAVHVLYGRRDGSDPAEQDARASAHLGLAVQQAAAVGAVVLVEALSAVPDYPLRTSGDVLAVLDRVEQAHGSAPRALCDLHHLAVNGEDPVAAVRAYNGRTGHVQVADVPGRHEPGTGSLDLAGCLAALEEVGYDGWTGLEYVPTGASADSFGWLTGGRGPGSSRGR